MGNEINGDVGLQLDEMLGLGEVTPEEEVSTTKEPEEETPKKEETPTTPNTTLVTDEQVVITKDIAKIDLQIEALETKNVDTDKFFETIEEHLSDAEQALEFDDKPAYMKVVNAKLKEFESVNSNTDEIEILKAQRLEKESIYERQSAITQVVSKHPSYKHEDVMNFFQKKLSADAQQEIYDAASSYADVYEKAFEKFTQNNPANIVSEPNPNIPDINNARKQPLKTNDVEESLISEDEKIQSALGL